MESLFVQTGATPPRGIILGVRKDNPSKSHEKYNGATVLVTTESRYRRVYRDKNGLYVILHGRKCPAYLATKG